MNLGPGFGGRIELDLLAGVIAGASASLHCLAMCGGIAAAIGASGGAGHAGVLRRAGIIAQASAGRILVYVTLGAAAGAAGWGFHEQAPPELARTAARWIAALVLGMAALTVLDIPIFGGRVGSSVARMAAPMTRRLHHLHRFGPIGLGLAWGLLPCAMVYLATFYAGLSGGPVEGALVMAGFGLGTAPAMIAAGAGAGLARVLARSQPVRWLAASVLIILAGLTAGGL